MMPTDQIDLSTNLFIGNSHVAAFKRAFGDSSDKTCRNFFCARSTDLCFVDLVGGAIIEDCNRDVDHRTLFFVEPYAPESARMKPAPGEVEKQFKATGGSKEIRLEAFHNIFYCVGCSPFDFVRYHPTLRVLTPDQATYFLKVLLGKSTALGNLIASLKQEMPQIRHHFIGTPLRALKIPDLTPHQRDVILFNRAILRESLAQGVDSGSIYDSVYCPDESCLDQSLLATRSEFSSQGRRDAERFQGQAVTKDDTFHMNHLYASTVVAEFVVKQLREN